MSWNFQRQTLNMKKEHGVKQRRRLRIDKFTFLAFSLSFPEIGYEFHSAPEFELVMLMFNHQLELVCRESQVNVT